MRILSSWQKIFRGEVSTKIGKADMFAVIADTTANASHVNQLSVLARYVDQEGYAQEHLVDIQGIDDKMVEGHAQGIQHRLPVQRLFYEGHLGREVPHFPCLAHCVNTTLQCSCQAITATCVTCLEFCRKCSSLL
jgi:hypothetical protein